MTEIYLDYNATTPLDPRVAQAMLDCERAYPANPSSQHTAGRRARQALDDASEKISSLLGLRTSGHRADRLIFTSGGTEANNLALLGLIGPLPARAIVSAVEHSSVLGPAAELARRGHQVEFLRVDRSGRIDLEHLEALLAQPARIVSIQLANHETGVLQSLSLAARLCRERGALLHTDAVQGVGKIPVDFTALGVAAMTVAAHKFYGPRGIGALALRGDLDVNPLLFGGFQQQASRPGTESVALVAGMRVALELAEAARDERYQRLAGLRDEFESRLGVISDLAIHGGNSPRLPQTSNISFVGLDRQALLMALDLAGVACSIGSACASGSAEPSTVLRAMGCSEPQLASALRFSFGQPTQAVEVAMAADRILKVCNDLRSLAGLKKSPSRVS